MAWKSTPNCPKHKKLCHVVVGLSICAENISCPVRIYRDSLIITSDICSLDNTSPRKLSEVRHLRTLTAHCRWLTSGWFSTFYHEWVEDCPEKHDHRGRKSTYIKDNLQCIMVHQLLYQRTTLIRCPYLGKVPHQLQRKVAREGRPLARPRILRDCQHRLHDPTFERRLFECVEPHMSFRTFVFLQLVMNGFL